MPHVGQETRSADTRAWTTDDRAWSFADGLIGLLALFAATALLFSQSG